MKVLGQGISLALVAAGLAAAPALAAQAAQAPAAPAAAQPSLVQKMKDTADGSVRTSRDDATGKVDFVRAGRNGDLLPATDAAPATAAVKADEYLTDFAAAFGAARGELSARVGPDERSRLDRQLHPVLRGCPGLRFDAAGARRTRTAA